MKVSIKGSSVVNYTEPNYLFCNTKRKIWGEIFLFDNSPFSEVNKENIDNLDFDDLIPRLSGNFFALEERSEGVVFATDFYGHSRYYYMFKNEEVIISDNIDLLDFKSSNYDYFQIIFFLTNGYTRNGGTFFKDLKIVSPTKRYTFKNNRLDQSFIPMTIYERSELETVVSQTLKSLTKEYKNVGLMFSSGIDSTYISLVARENNIGLNNYFGKVDNPLVEVVEQDNFLVNELINKEKFHVQICRMNVYKELEETIEMTMNALPFDFHNSLVQHNIFEKCVNQGIKMIISGQNSDALYNFGNTTFVPYKTTLRALLHGKLEGAGLTVCFNRYIQTARFQKHLIHNKNGMISKLIWKHFANNELNLKNYIKSFLISKSVIPHGTDWNFQKYMSKPNDSIYDEEIEKEIDELLVTLQFGESVHQLLLRSLLISYCQGRDVQCMTAWAKQLGIENCQLFSTAPVFNWLANNELNMKDIHFPKRKLRYYIKKHSSYFKLRKSIPSNIENTFQSEKDYFEDLFNKIPQSVGKEECIKVARNVLRKSECINVDKFDNYCNSDKIYAFRAMWAGYTLRKFGK